MQPRQIYASTLTRRDRRWARRRGRGLVGIAVVTACAVAAAFTVLAAVAPSIT